MIFTNRDDFSRLWFKFAPIKSLLVSETGLWLEPWRWLNNLRFQLTEGGLGRHGPLPCSPQEHTHLTHIFLPYMQILCRKPLCDTHSHLYLHPREPNRNAITHTHTRALGHETSAVHPQCLGSPRQSEEKASEASVYWKNVTVWSFSIETK